MQALSKISVYTLLLFLCNNLFAQSHSHAHHGHDHAAHQQTTPVADDISFAGVREDAAIGKKTPSFIQNKNQWHENILYQTAFSGTFNGLFLEKNRLTYQVYDQEALADLHALKDQTEGDPIKGHSYHVNFKNAVASDLEAVGVRSEKYNYFIGNDAAKWASNVPASEEVFYRNLYENIDLRLYRDYTDIKYEFIVAPFGNPADIVLEYEGADKVELEDGKLKIHTSVAIITELQPYTYQIIDGKEVKVESRYILEGNEVTFFVSDDYDRTVPLVIDPTVVAATLTGHNIFGSSGVFGHTACFDTEGNIYAGGLAYGSGYTVTTGAFDLDFNGDRDMVFSKFNPNGTDLIYATYIGGEDADFPQSIITDFGQQLYIYGSSNSADFPTTANAFQPNHAGNFDAIVTVLSSDGSTLIGSTYVGGSNEDGVNFEGLNKNYGDTYRGEIITDASNNVYVATGTDSPDFPVVNGFDTSFNNEPAGDAQDGVVFKLSSDLSFMHWSTFLGGDDADFAMGLRLDDENNVYVTGYAGESNFPTTSGTVNDQWPGGEENAFVVQIQNDGGALLASTFWGTTDDEHGYMLDIDEEGNVHIFGQTTGYMPVTDGVFASQAGSPQFISAFTSDLTEVVYSTVIGEGPGGAGHDYYNSNVDLVPVAFMVDKCNNIYFSGYGASDNLPLTTGAFWTQGDSFYLGVLEPNAEDLAFATYYGRSNHVDGGTSRFDKGGIVYQAVCSCTNGGDNAMNTNPNAYETDMPGSTCDVGVFKIDFETSTVTAAGTILEAGTNVVSSSGCAPFAVDFIYTGQDATEWYWNFGDGGESTLENPSHIYQEAGNYPVYLVVANPFTCNELDTVFLQVDVLDNTNQTTVTSFCEGEDITFDVSVQNASYLWQDGFTGSTYQVDTPGTYFVNIDIGSCARTDTFIVNPFLNLDVDIGDEIIIACDQDSYTFDGTIEGAQSYLWQDGVTDPMRTVSSEGFYELVVTDENNCVYSDDAQLFFGDTPSVELGEDVLLCDGESYSVDASFPDPNVTYTWSDGTTDPLFTTNIGGTYTVVLSDDGCEATDSVTVEYYPEFVLNTDLVPIECSGDCNGSVTVEGTGGSGNLQYLWSTGDTDLSLTNLCPDVYTLTVTDDAGCEYVSEFNLTNPDVLTFAADGQDLICAGDGSGIVVATDVNGGVSPYMFSLNGGEYTESGIFTDLAAGNYTLSLLDAVNCEISTEITLTQPPEYFVEAGEDVSVELGETTRLNGSVTPMFGQEILWTPDLTLTCTECLTPETTPPNTTQYFLTATDLNTGCEVVDSVTVEVIKVRKVFIPNAFSPNFDGINDEFMVFGHIGVEEVEEFQVWSRWGSLVFENTNFPPNKTGFGWDGYWRGKLVNTGVFAYTARVRYYDGEVGYFKGDVTVVR